MSMTRGTSSWKRLTAITCERYESEMGSSCLGKREKMTAEFWRRCYSCGSLKTQKTTVHSLPICCCFLS